MIVEDNMELDIQLRTQKAEEGIFEALDGVGIPADLARQYAVAWAPGFVQQACWSVESLEILRELGAKYIEDETINVYERITAAVKPYAMTFAERVVYGLKDVSKDELEQYQADLEALEEMRHLCCDDDACPVTDEHREYFHLLANGVDPFDVQHSHGITNKDIEAFKTAARQFGLPEDEISLRVAIMTSNTTLGKIHKEISKYEEGFKRQEHNNKVLCPKTYIGPFRRE